MNKKSKELVRHISRGQMDVLEYGELREALREEEVEAMRIAKERKEMKDCTFRPKIERNMVYFWRMAANTINDDIYVKYDC